jgi:hypothetical protein
LSYNISVGQQASNTMRGGGIIKYVDKHDEDDGICVTYPKEGTKLFFYCQKNKIFVNCLNVNALLSIVSKSPFILPNDCNLECKFPIDFCQMIRHK